MALSKSAENNFDDYYMIIDLYEGNLPIVRNHRMQVKDSLMLIYKKHPEMIQNGIEMDCTKMCFDRNNRTDQYLIYLFSSIDKSLSDLLDLYEEYYHGHYTFRIDRPNNFNGILVHKVNYPSLARAK